MFHVGEQCNEPSCRQLDFLPFKCSGCQKFFCHQHRAFADHHCTNAPIQPTQTAECPLCDRVIAAPSEQALHKKLTQHIELGCESDSSKQADQKKRQCGHPKCKVISLMPIFCKNCHTNYCLKHRMPLDHNCSQVQLEHKLARLHLPIFAH